MSYFWFALTLIAVLHYVSSDENVYDVIVVGGGVSGLSTCANLFGMGIKNILLIEADDRLGGRINTIHYGKTNQYFFIKIS